MRNAKAETAFLHAMAAARQLNSSDYEITSEDSAKFMSRSTPGQTYEVTGLSTPDARLVCSCPAASAYRVCKHTLCLFRHLSEEGDTTLLNILGTRAGSARAAQHAAAAQATMRRRAQEELQLARQTEQHLTAQPTKQQPAATPAIAATPGTLPPPNAPPAGATLANLPPANLPPPNAPPAGATLANLPPANLPPPNAPPAGATLAIAARTTATASASSSASPPSPPGLLKASPIILSLPRGNASGAAAKERASQRQPSALTARAFAYEMLALAQQLVGVADAAPEDADIRALWQGAGSGVVARIFELAKVLYSPAPQRPPQPAAAPAAAAPPAAAVPHPTLVKVSDSAITDKQYSSRKRHRQDSSDASIHPGGSPPSHAAQLPAPPPSLVRVKAKRGEASTAAHRLPEADKARLQQDVDAQRRRQQQQQQQQHSKAQRGPGTAAASQQQAAAAVASPAMSAQHLVPLVPVGRAAQLLAAHTAHASLQPLRPLQQVPLGSTTPALPPPPPPLPSSATPSQQTLFNAMRTLSTAADAPGDAGTTLSLLAAQATFASASTADFLFVVSLGVVRGLRQADLLLARAPAHLRLPLARMVESFRTSAAAAAP